ncbi:methyltransferase domain-containing protein [Nocardia abscessus]|uniref:methyltransferase domain-containing protein n=1 Tax=Nocardia abscessus TaxID=120957 RepID=UPI003CC7C5D8
MLDVGCGGGQLAVGLATAGTTLRLTGIDLSPQQVRRAPPAPWGGSPPARRGGRRSRSGRTRRAAGNHRHRRRRGVWWRWRRRGRRGPALGRQIGRWPRRRRGSVAGRAVRGRARHHARPRAERTRSGHPCADERPGCPGVRVT